MTERFEEQEEAEVGEEESTPEVAVEDQAKQRFAQMIEDTTNAFIERSL